jgi:hypothetical protein
MMRRTAELRLLIARRTLRAEACRGGTAWNAEATYASAAELVDVIARLAGECGVRCTRMRVALKHPPVQLRTLVDLPPVRAPELAALVAHHVSRFFRKNGERLVTDAVWVGTNGTRVARAAAVEESLVQAIAAGARAAGLTLDTIAVADSDVPLALLPAPERALRARAERRRMRLLGVTAAGTWALVGALFVARVAWERRVVDRELTRLAAPLAAVLAARREVHDVEAALGAIARVDRERSRAISLLAAVTAAFPDSSVLTSLTWGKDGRTMLSGAARQAAEVASRLDRVPGIAPRFDGPVVRERVAGREWERFTIVLPGDGGRGKRDGL